MSDKILFVDDEANILDAYKRQLKKLFHIETAQGGEQGLSAVTNQGAYAVIISDLRMPGMDGVQFLSRVKEVAPDSIRMMLSGHADLQTAIEAVNEGNIFRFLTKPCKPDVLAKSIAAGIRQYRLIMAEKELMEKTLSGTIKVLTDILAFINPEALGRSSRITRYVRQIALEIETREVWQLETAARLSQIGCLVLPEGALKKLYQGRKLTEEEKQIFNMHPAIASNLLVNIPRMEKIAEIIAYQEKHFDGSGIPRDSRQGGDIPLGAKILKVVIDFDSLEVGGKSKGEALEEIKKRPGWYDPNVVAALEAVIGGEAGHNVRAVTVSEIKENMVLAEDILTRDGQVLLPKGQEVSQQMSDFIKKYAQTTAIKEPIRVMTPIEGQVEKPG